MINSLMMAPTPTMAPTPLVCSDDEATFEVDITFDGYSCQTSWVLENECTGEQVITQAYNYGETSDLYSACIPRGERYTFVVSDWDDYYGDGPNSGGTITVNYDGGEYELEVETNEKESSASATFGASTATCAPTMAPTPLVCSDDEATFEVDITFDDHSEDISWVLENECTGEQVITEAYDYGETSDLYSACIPRGERYTFVVFDYFVLDGPNSGVTITVNYDGGEQYELEIEDNGENSFRSSASATLGASTTTCAPTMAPTPLVCSDDEASFEVDITFDDHSNEISWVLENECTGEQVITEAYDYGETSDLYSACIPRGGYIFEIFDSAGDGLNSGSDGPNSGGTITVNYDGGEYELEVEDNRENNFGSSASATIGASTCSPTTSPSPTMAPSPSSEFCIDDGQMKVSVIVRTDNWPSDISWTIADPDNNVVANDDDSFMSNKLYKQAICLTEMCGSGSSYTFTIMDSYGDGILNPGYYKVLVDGVRVDGGDGLNSNERSIEINGCPSTPTTPPVSPCTEDEVEVALELQTDRYHSETSFEIRNAETDAIVVPMTYPPSPQRIMRESYCLEKLSKNTNDGRELTGSNDGGDYVFHIHDTAGDGLMDEGKDFNLSGHFKLFVDGELVRGDSDGNNFGFMDTVVIDTSGASKKQSKTSKKNKATKTKASKAT
jgi:hypothetical protein